MWVSIPNTIVTGRPSASSASSKPATPQQEKLIFSSRGVPGGISEASWNRVGPIPLGYCSVTSSGSSSTFAAVSRRTAFRSTASFPEMLGIRCS